MPIIAALIFQSMAWRMKCGCPGARLPKIARAGLAFPPARAFLSFRIEAASRELKSSGKTVREVSDFFGFDNPFQFSRAFKRIFGAAPVSFKS